MFRIKWLQPSILYFLLGLVTLFSLLYVERVFLAQKDTSSVIVIDLDTDTTLENSPPALQQVATLSDKLRVMLDDMTASVKELDKFYTQPDYQALNEDEKLLLTSLLSQHLYEKRQYQLVIDILTPVEFEKRVLHDVQFLYAYSLSRTDQRQEAIKQYRLLSTKDQRSQSTHLNLGLLLQKTGQCADAMPVFNKAISISSGIKKAKAFSGNAKCHYQSGLFNESVELFKKSIEYRPNSAKIWIKLANSMAAAGHPLADIIDTYDKGIALDDRNYKAYLQKARFLLANFLYPEVIQTLDEAAKDSSNAELLELQIWAYLEQGRRNLARKALKKIDKKVRSKALKEKTVLIRLYLDKKYSSLINKLKKRKSLSDDLLYLKGLTYRRLGFYKSAFATFKDLEDKAEFGWRVSIQKARMTRSRKQYPEAIAQFERLLAHNDRAAFLWFEAALVHENLAQYPEGLQKIETAINLSPKKPPYHLAKARLLEHSGNTQAAIENLEALLATKPRYARALRLLAEISTKTEDLDRLIEIYQQLLAINSSDYEAMLNLAVTFARAQDTSMARSTLQTLLSEKSDHLEARYLLAQNFYADGLYPQSLQELDKLLKLDASHIEANLLREKLLIMNDEKNEDKHS